MFSKVTLRSWKIKRIFWNIYYIRMRRKLINDYWLKYLNDLFGIKLIILQSELNVPTFRIWVDFNNFLLKDATDRSKISSDKERLFFAVNPLNTWSFVRIFNFLMDFIILDNFEEKNYIKYDKLRKYIFRS